MLYYTPRHITYSTTGSGFCQGLSGIFSYYSVRILKFFAGWPQDLMNITYYISKGFPKFYANMGYRYILYFLSVDSEYMAEEVA